MSSIAAASCLLASVAAHAFMDAAVLFLRAVALSCPITQHTPIPPFFIPPTVLNPQFSLALAVALRDKRKRDKATRSTSRLLNSSVCGETAGQMGPTPTQTQTKGLHIHQRPRSRSHPSEARVDGNTLPLSRLFSMPADQETQWTPQLYNEVLVVIRTGRHFYKDVSVFVDWRSE